MSLLWKIIIIILILLVFGLYFKPQITKSIIRTTGHTIEKTGEKIISGIKENETFKDISENIKDIGNGILGDEE